MKKIIFQLISILLMLNSFSCQKNQVDNNVSILESHAYTIEKLSCDDNNRYFDWRCSFTENYIQKDISTAIKKNYIFNFSSSNFNRDNYGFVVLIFVNNIIRFRRSTRDFPFATTLEIPNSGTVSIKTYFEQYASGNPNFDQSGHVNCRVSCQ